MATKRLVLGEWTPDQPGLTGALQQAFNVFPEQIGYGPFPSVTDFSNDAAQPLIGTVAAKFGDTVQLFAAGATRLYKFDPNDLDLDDVSKLVMASPADYTSTSRWNFTQFGNQLIAANGQNVLQKWTIGSSLNWDDLSADAPIGAYLTVVRDFVVTARNSSAPNRVYWSDINNETLWTAGPTSQADSQVIPDGGNIQGITGGEFGIVLLEKSIVRMSYIGAPLFFQFDTLSRTLGCYEPNSVVQYENKTYFLSSDGFYVCDGSAIVPIGGEKVDRFFFDNVDEGNLDKMSAVVDPERQLVIWVYPNTNGKISFLIYNWQVNRWSNGVTTCDFIAPSATTGTTLEQLNIYGGLEDVPASLDSRLWAGGKTILSGVRGSKIILFGGAPMPAEIITGDVEDGMQSIVKLALPQVDGGSASVAVASRFRLDGGINFGTLLPASGENRVPLRSVGRYHRFRLVPSGDWKNIMAVDIETQPVGNR
jgi:hypothetical protein